MLQFFLEILQAVCLGFVHIPKIGQLPFQIIEEKLVQRLLKIYVLKLNSYNFCNLNVFTSEKAHNMTLNCLPPGPLHCEMGVFPHVIPTVGKPSNFL